MRFTYAVSDKGPKEGFWVVVDELCRNHERAGQVLRRVFGDAIKHRPQVLKPGTWHCLSIPLGTDYGGVEYGVTFHRHEVKVNLPDIYLGYRYHHEMDAATVTLELRHEGRPDESFDPGHGWVRCSPVPNRQRVAE